MIETLDAPNCFSDVPYFDALEDYLAIDGATLADAACVERRVVPRGVKNTREHHIRMVQQMERTLRMLPAWVHVTYCGSDLISIDQPSFRRLFAGRLVMSKRSGVTIDRWMYVGAIRLECTEYVSDSPNKNEAVREMCH